MVDPKQIENAAEQAVAQQLKHAGWPRVQMEQTQQGPNNIVATDGKRNLLVTPRIGVDPNQPPHMGPEEVNMMKQKAQGIEADLYQARVTLDQQLRPQGEVLWKRL